MAAPIVTAAIATIVKIGTPLLFKKVEEKVVERISNEGIESEVEKTIVAYDGVSKKKSAAWVAVVVALLTMAQSMGYIDSSLAQALIDLVQNEAVQEAVSEAVE